MKSILKLLFLIITFTNADTLIVDDKVKFLDLLPYSKIYIDETQKLNFSEVRKLTFNNNTETLLGFGYSPEFTVWIKFTLENSTEKRLNKVLEYDNALTTNISFYSAQNNYIPIKEGIFNIDVNRKSINPSFQINLEKNEKQTYFLELNSHVTTLIVKLNLWNQQTFFSNEIMHQLILAFFIGAMIILGIYNLFIYLFTKDISYFYYVLYIVGVVIHHIMYVGFSYIYILKPEQIAAAIAIAPAIVSLPIFAMGLFTKSFLQVKQYPKNNIVLNTLLILVPITTFLFIAIESISRYRNLLIMILLVYLILLTCYAVIKKNRQAYFLLLGWFIIAATIMLMNLSSFGLFSINLYYPYIVETGLLLEMIVFSIALADRINFLQQDKNEATKKLLDQQKNEKHKLEITVNEKTKDLKHALNEKGLLLKELNHRVKNNMQTIISLIRLQNENVTDLKLKDTLTTIQNRINAMSHLHELLYQKDVISDVNAYEYFDLIVEELKESYENDININFDIKTKLDLEQAIYCGLILNELITNSFKYAFVNKDNGSIYISLKKENGTFKLNVKDDGIGFSQTKEESSLGLTLIRTLATKQLKGSINIDSDKSTNVDIFWRSYD